MTEAADLRVKVQADGTAKTVAELKAVSSAVDEVGDEARGTGEDMLAMSADSGVATAALGALNVAATGLAAVGVASLIGELISLVGVLAAIAGGALAAAGGFAILGAGLAYVGVKSLEAATGTTHLKDAWAKLTAGGTPIGKAMDNLRKTAASMAKPFMEFIQRIAPAVIGSFTYIIQVLKENLGPILDAISTQTLKWLGVLRDLVTNVAPYFSKFITDFSTAFLRLGKVMVDFAVPGLKAFMFILDGLSKGITNIIRPLEDFLIPVGRQVGDVFKVLGTQIGHIAGAFAPTLVPFLKNLASILQSVGQFFVRMAPGLSLVALAISKALSVVFDGVTAGSHKLNPLFRPIGQLFRELGDALGALAGPALKLFLTALSTLARILTPILKALMPVFLFLMKAVQKVLEAVAPYLVTIAKALAEGFTQAFAALKPYLGDFIDALTQLLVAVLEALVPLLPVLIPLFVSLVKAMVPLIQIATDILIALTPLIKLFGDVLAALMSGDWSKAEKDLRRIWNNIKDAAVTAVQAIWQWVKELPGKIWDWLKQQAGKMVEAGKNLIRALWQGVLSLGSWLLGQVGDFLHRYIIDPIVNAYHGLKDKLSGTVTVSLPTGPGVGLGAGAAGGLAGTTTGDQISGGGHHRGRAATRSIDLHTLTTIELDGHALARAEHRRQVALGLTD